LTGEHIFDHHLSFFTPMSDQELRDLVGSLAHDTQALKTQIAASEAMLAEERRKTEEQRRNIEVMLAEERRKTEEQRRNIEAMLAEEHRKTEEERRKTEHVLSELGRQIGGLGNKFGYFAEGMFLPPIERILTRFSMTTIVPRLRVRRGGKEIEIDALGYANGELNTAFVVEVKSNFRREHIAEMLNVLGRFGEFMPEHRDKALFGLLAVVDAPSDLCSEALREGIYVARVGDTIAELITDASFQARDFRR
jgi:hypothetical protein